jgi:hypothetical protein
LPCRAQERFAGIQAMGIDATEEREFLQQRLADVERAEREALRHVQRQQVLRPTPSCAHCASGVARPVRALGCWTAEGTKRMCVVRI